MFAVWLPDGAPTLLPGASSIRTGVWTSQDGKYAAFFDAAGAVNVLDVSVGARHQVDVETGSYATLLWSANGGYLALETPYPGTSPGGLAVVAADGTKATSLTINGAPQAAVFSPDSTRLAYDAPDSSGTPELVVHSLVGGVDIHIQGLPDPASNYVNLYFSSDGTVLFVMTRPRDSSTLDVNTSVYTASTGGNGSLHFITSHAYTVPASPPGDSNLAVMLDSGYTKVFSLAGADSNLLPGGSPVYEPNSDQPRLLLTPLSQSSASNPVPAFVLASTDGASMNTELLPRSASPWGPQPQWMGHFVMYGFSPALTGDFPAIYASSGSSTSPTLLAAAPDTYAWAFIHVPTRLFYARRTASNAFPAGLWMAAIP